MSSSRIFAAILFVTFGFVCPKRAVAVDWVQVQVSSTVIRSSPSPWAPKVTDAAYEDELSLLESSGGNSGAGQHGQWVRVKTSRGQIGFVHVSAITSRRIEVKGSAQAKPVASSTSQVVLAGKGFSSRIEGEYKRENPALDFSFVDTVETYKPIESIQSFAKKGKLLG